MSAATDANNRQDAWDNEQNEEYQKQIETYIAWVNSQLKKRAGNKPVTDLKTDFRDGVVLVTLVEIISGEKLDGVYIPAKNLEEKRRNINSVLKFLTKKSIRMHHITEKDVINGNVKSLMKLILTLAAHFKPASVGKKKTVNAAAAANAKVALSDIHKNVSLSGGFRPRWKSSTPTSDYRRNNNSSSSSSRTTSNRSDLPKTGSDETDSFSLNKLSSSDDVWASPSLPQRSSRTGNDCLATTTVQNLSSINSEVILTSGGSRDASNVSEQLTEHYNDLESDLSSTCDLISVLQNLLLNGEEPGDGDNEQSLPLEASSQDEENVILRSRLDLSQHENNRLKTELTDVRQECRSTSANISALRSRTQQQEKELLSMKQQILKLNLASDNLKQEKDYLAAQIEENKRAKQSLSDEVSEKNITIKHLKDELTSMSTQLKKIGDESKSKLTSMQRLESQVQELSQQLRVLQRYKQSSKPERNGNETTVISESLNSLRSNLAPHDSRQHIIDTLEQAVMSLTERDQRNNNQNYGRKSELSVPRLSASHSPRNRKKDMAQKTASTTVIYFTERNMTPARASIFKKIGEITLRDFKSVIQVPADNYKFNFKALDPEFGTVKKEIFNDNDIVPGWEGKIVAWLERE
ncbi:dixin-like [Styela clava]